MNKTFTTEELALIHVEQVKQIENPVRAVVNGECAFISDRLEKVQSGLGSRYWHAYVMNRTFGDAAVDSNQITLTGIDRQSRMPSWGTYGT